VGVMYLILTLPLPGDAYNFSVFKYLVRQYINPVARSPEVALTVASFDIVK